MLCEKSGQDVEKEAMTLALDELRDDGNGELPSVDAELFFEL